MNFDEKVKKIYESCITHYRIDKQEKRPEKYSISDQPLKSIRALEVLPGLVNPKKKTRIIFDYDPDFPYTVLQVIEEDQPEIKEQEQPEGKAQTD